MVMGNKKFFMSFNRVKDQKSPAPMKKNKTGRNLPNNMAHCYHGD